MFFFCRRETVLVHHLHAIFYDERQHASTHAHPREKERDKAKLFKTKTEGTRFSSRSLCRQKCGQHPFCGENKRLAWSHHAIVDRSTSCKYNLRFFTSTSSSSFSCSSSSSSSFCFPSSLSIPFPPLLLLFLFLPSSSCSPYPPLAPLLVPSTSCPLPFLSTLLLLPLLFLPFLLLPSSSFSPPLLAPLLFLLPSSSCPFLFYPSVRIFIRSSYTLTPLYFHSSEAKKKAKQSK